MSAPTDPPSTLASPESPPPEPPLSFDAPAEPPAAPEPAEVPAKRRWFGAGRKAPGPRPPARELSTRFMVCTLMMAMSFIMVLWNLQDSSLENANTGSRYATIESLVERGTYWIDDSRYVGTIDKYKVGGHYISSKPPMLSTLAAGVYWTQRAITGKSIRKTEGAVVRLVSLCTGGLFHLIFLTFFYRLCVLLLKREVAIVIAMDGSACCC